MAGLHKLQDQNLVFLSHLWRQDMVLGDAKKVMRVLSKINDNEGFLVFKSLEDIELVKIKIYYQDLLCNWN